MLRGIYLLLSGVLLFGVCESVSADSSIGRHYIGIDQNMFEVSATTVEEAENCFGAVFKMRNYSPKSDEVALFDGVKRGSVMADLWYKRYVLVFFAENDAEAEPKAAIEIFRGFSTTNSEQLLLTAKACNERVKVVY